MSESDWFSCLEIWSLSLSLRQKSQAKAAGTIDTRKHGLAAALEEHCLDNRQALHATGTTKHP
jgi:hypothetical protein